MTASFKRKIILRKIERKCKMRKEKENEYVFK